MKTDFPFNIMDVLSALSIPIRKRDGNFLYIDCPVCYEQNTEKKGKCQIRLDTNVFNCPRCGTGGGMLRLYSLVKGCSKEEANRAMRDWYKSPISGSLRQSDELKKGELNTKDSFTAPKQIKLAPKPVIDKTYRELLALCDLRKEHKQNLLKRGLTDKQIAHYGFKSVPWKNESTFIVEQLLAKGCTVKGVPGFYEENGVWKMAVSYKNRGMFVPMINIKGQCLGLQIRLDHPIDGTKYIWLSSSRYNSGCARTAIPTFSNIWNVGRTVCITEGGLKAYVAHSLSGATFIGIPGVTQFKLLPLLFTQLKKKGVTTICDCFDSATRS